MSDSLKTIKRRIRSVENTRKITQAMEMVSGTKLKKSEAILRAGWTYLAKLESMLKRLLGDCGVLAHSLLEERPKKNIGLCVVTSDTGMCSNYNDNIIGLAENFIRERGKKNVKIVCVGKKAFNYFKRHGFNIVHSYTGLQGVVAPALAQELSNRLTEIFLNAEVDEVHIVYMHFISVLKYKPTVEKFLNIQRQQAQEIDYILEPGKDKILEELIPKYVLTKTRFMLLDAFTSEHSARMIAMKAATDNAARIIEDLTLLRNKARQASITKEIIEVSSSAQLLKG